MPDRILGDREKAMEESYFRKQEAVLLEKLRQRANLDEISVALGEALQVDNPDLLKRVRDAGITLETGPALLLAPLVQVAWAGGSVSKEERAAVLRLARGREVEADTPAYAQLNRWLDQRPPDSLFELAIEVLKYGFSVLPPEERDERIKRMIDACQEVAEASGSTLGWVLGLKSVDHTEASTLDAIGKMLRSRSSG